jgi:hypothetical protein
VIPTHAGASSRSIEFEVDNEARRVVFHSASLASLINRDCTRLPTDVRFAPKADKEQIVWVSPLCANRDPTHRSKPLLYFDGPGSATEQHRRHGEAERLGGLEIGDELELGWLLDRQVAGFCAFVFLVIASFSPSTYRRGPDFISKETQ